MQKSKANSNTRRTGFTVVELVITGTVLAVVTSVGLIGITKARATVRLSGAAREYASYIEKARLFSIRSHADDATERASITINDDKASYNVTLDLDGDGDLDTTTITLPSGVTFDTVETIAFDWRGRTWSTVGGLTSSNAQVSIRLGDGSDTVSIDVTGSGDVTVDSKVFDDAVPHVNLRVPDLANGATPVPTPTTIVTTPTPTGSPVPISTPDPELNPTPTPDPVGDVISNPTPTPTSTATPTPTPRATATPTPDSVPTPTPVPSVCNISADMLTLSLLRDGTATVKVSHDANTTLTISGSSSKASDIQVTPASQTVAAGTTASFTIKSKKSIGLYSITFSASCGSRTVTALVAL